MDNDELTDVVRQMWAMHTDEVARFDRIYDYLKGQRGVPDVPDGANAELKQLAPMSVKNVISLVVDSFVPNLSVVGYRTATGTENSPAWLLWQRERMDARQAEVHRAALAFGVAYVAVTPDANGLARFRPRSPRQMIAVYADPQVDEYPQYALETWIDNSATGNPRLRGLLLDSTTMRDVDLGEVSAVGTNLPSHTRRFIEISEPRLHGLDYCPVIRYINTRDAEDLIVGEVEPLIPLQRAINSVNFDRMCVSRFGAFPQKAIIGRDPSTLEALKVASSRAVMFPEHPSDLRIDSWPAASVEPYNSILSEMEEHVAMVAQISPAKVTGKMVQLTAEALAAAEASEQRKTGAKRESLGESHESLLRTGALMEGDAETAFDDQAEVIWRDTEARSFGAVVDGVQKLAASGIPIDALLPLVPGLSQQQIQAIRERIAGTGEIVEALERLANSGTDLSGRDADAGAPARTEPPR